MKKINKRAQFAERVIEVLGIAIVITCVLVFIPPLFHKSKNESEITMCQLSHDFDGDGTVNQLDQPCPCNPDTQAMVAKVNVQRFPDLKALGNNNYVCDTDTKMCKLSTEVTSVPKPCSALSDEDAKKGCSEYYKDHKDDKTNCLPAICMVTDKTGTPVKYCETPQDVCEKLIRKQCEDFVAENAKT